MPARWRWRREVRMAEALSQNKRLFYIDTPLGKDKLLVRKLHGREAMSEAFLFESVINIYEAQRPV